LAESVFQEDRDDGRIPVWVLATGKKLLDKTRGFVDYTTLSIE
jgi:hypothetical protein